MADAVVFKLDAMTPKKPVLRKREVKFVCCKCGHPPPGCSQGRREGCSAASYGCADDLEQSKRGGLGGRRGVCKCCINCGAGAD
eukprot:4082177-Prymnesium_polylepis.1